MQHTPRKTVFRRWILATLMVLLLTGTLFTAGTEAVYA